MTDETRSTDARTTVETAPRVTTQPRPADLRGETTTARDRSAHRSHAWLYEDLLA